MYFDKCKTLDELKAEYRRLAVKYHPDTGGDLEAMKAVNAEHDRVFEILKKKHNDSADEYHQTTETAEIGAAALMNRVGIETARTFENSAAYIQSWLRALRNDTRMIVSASSRAEKAVNYIINGAA